MPNRLSARIIACLLAILGVAEPCRADQTTTAPFAATALVDLAERAEWNALASRIDAGDLIDATQPDGMTALHWAVFHENAGAVASLLAAGADANAATEYAVTPLEIACTAGNAAIGKRLLDAGADASHTMPTGRTMLMTASRSGAARLASHLLAAGADVNAVDNGRQSALMWAAAEGHADVASMLIEAEADINDRTPQGFNAMLFAARNGRLAVCDRLLDAGVDVNQAIKPKNTSGRNPRRGMSPLLFAVESGHFELALHLVSRGADPNDQRSGFAPLHALTWVRRANRGDGIDGDPEPAGSGNVTSLGFARELVAAGASVDLKLKQGRGGKAILSPRGCTPLLLASHAADLPYMNTLLDLGADPHATSAEGCTTLMVAAGVGVRSLVDEDPGTEAEVIAAVIRLHRLGVNINAVDDNGETAMHGAAYRNYPLAVTALHELGADPAVWNRPNKHGWTPLDIAAGKRPGAFKPSPPTTAALQAIINHR